MLVLNTSNKPKVILTSMKFVVLIMVKIKEHFACLFTILYFKVLKNKHLVRMLVPTKISKINS